MDMVFEFFIKKLIIPCIHVAVLYYMTKDIEYISLVEGVNITLQNKIYKC